MKNFGFALAAYTIIWGLLAFYLAKLTIQFARFKKEYLHLKRYLEEEKQP